jgi:hypothetical protein
MGLEPVTLSRAQGSLLGHKQNLGHPVNDLFDLRNVRPQEAECEDGAPKGFSL